MKGRTEFTMCRRKKRYTIRQAHRVAGHLNERQKKRVHSYRCPVCGHYHVGGYRKNDRERTDSEDQTAA